MNELLSNIRAVLEGAGYATYTPRPDSRYIFFEDINVLGYLEVLSSTKEIINNWLQIQDNFLLTNASRFQKDPQKAWNLYAIFISPNPASSEEQAKLLTIEEDFRSTRKIARAGIQTRDDILVALGPIIPLQNIQPVGIKDAYRRLRDRLATAHPILQDITTDMPVKEIVQKFMESE